MRSINSKKVATLGLTVAAAMSMASCSLPMGRVQFDPYSDDGFAATEGPTKGEAAEVESNQLATEGKLDFYEFRRPKVPSPLLLKADNSAYVLGAGDTLQIEIVEAPETRAEAVVMPDGMLYYDVAEGVRAGGRTLAQVEAELAKQLEKEYAFPIVTASLQNPTSRGFTILGQIRNPGSYALTKPTRLLSAIAEAGGSGGGNGASALADLPRCVVIRAGEVLPVDFSALIEEGDMRHNIYLQPGDYVFMPAEGRDKVFVLGAVKTPTAVPFSSRVSVVAAVASAHGLAEEAFPQGALVVRGSFSNPQFAPVNLNKVMRGQQPNFTLMPGDIIWVPAKPWQKLSEYVKLGIASAASSYSLRESSKIFFGEVDRSQSAAGVRTSVTSSSSTSSNTGI
ncbi:MAG: polysaccharide biosynthesis/export family protein [Verrucomicrobiales bacterium]